MILTADYAKWRSGQKHPTVLNILKYAVKYPNCICDQKLVRQHFSPPFRLFTVFIAAKQQQQQQQQQSEIVVSRVQN